MLAQLHFNTLLNMAFVCKTFPAVSNYPLYLREHCFRQHMHYQEVLDDITREDSGWNGSSIDYRTYVR